MSGHGEDAAFERSGRDRGDVINEPLLGDFGQLDAHVASAGDDVIALEREGGAERPITMRTHLDDLLAVSGLDRANRVIRTTEGDEFVVGRPAYAIKSVVAEWSRDCEL